MQSCAYTGEGAELLPTVTKPLDQSDELLHRGLLLVGGVERALARVGRRLIAGVNDACTSEGALFLAFVELLTQRFEESLRACRVVVQQALDVLDVVSVESGDGQPARCGEHDGAEDQIVAQCDATVGEGGGDDGLQ